VGALAPEGSGCPAVADVAARAPLPAGPPVERNRISHLVVGPAEAVGPTTRTAALNEESWGW